MLPWGNRQYRLVLGALFRLCTHQSVAEGGDVALGVAVASSVDGTALVELALAALRLHLRQIQRAVHAARQLRHIHVEAELAARQLQHLVRLVVLGEQVDPRRQDVADVLVVEHVQRHGVAVDRHAVGRVVVEALHDALLVARLDVRARRHVGRAAGAAAAVLGRVDLVQGPAEGVEHDGRVLGHAAALLGAAVGRQLRVRLGGDGTLGGGEAGQGDEGCERGHCDGCE
jgi:hypothetical protein